MELKRTLLTMTDLHSDDLLSRFEIDGFVGPITLMSQIDAQKAWSEFQDWNVRGGGMMEPCSRFKTHLVLPTASRMVHNPKLLRVLETILETTNILCWSTDWNIKQPISPDHFAPHQDSTFAGLEPAEKVVTVWVAISDPVTENEGCLSFWIGSHKLGQIPHKSSDSIYNMLSRQQCCQPPQGQSSTSIPLRAGQATIHNFRTVHSSGPNHSNHMRVGFAMRFMAASVRQRGAVRESVTVVGGKSEHDGFDLEPILPSRPTLVDVENGKRAQAVAVHRESENYFRGSVL